MRISHRQIHMYLLWLFLAFTINFFYLDIFGSFQVSDFSLLIGIIIVARGVKFMTKATFQYSIFAMGAFLLAVTSAVQSNCLNGQPFFLGIRPQRIYLITWALYFPLSALLQNNKINIINIFKVIRSLGLISLTLFTIQFFLGESFLFLNCGYNYRYNTIRLYAATVFIDLLLFISLNEQINLGKFQLRNMLEITWCIFYIIVVNKGRKMLLCYLLVVALAIFFWKKGRSKRLIVLLLGAFAVSSVLTDEMIGSFISLFDGSDNVSVEIRADALLHWMKIIRKHWLLGGGYVNTQYLPAYQMAGVHLNYFFVDNGFFGFLYQYGCLGAIWNVALFIKLFVEAKQIRHKHNNIIIYLFLAFSLAGFRGGGWISFSYNTFPVVFACLVSDYYRSTEWDANLSMEGLRV